MNVVKIYGPSMKLCKVTQVRRLYEAGKKPDLLLQYEITRMLPLLNPVTQQMSDSSVVCKVKYLAAVQSLCHWEFWAVPVEDVTIYNAQCHHAPSCRVAVWKHHLGHQTSPSATHSSLSVMHQSQSTSLPPSFLPPSRLITAGATAESVTRASLCSNDQIHLTV